LKASASTMHKDISPWRSNSSGYTLLIARAGQGDSLPFPFL
jgi:hypothetical protein